MSERPRQIPTQEEISQYQIEKRLRELNARIVLAYEIIRKEKDRKIILDRLFHEKNILYSVQNKYNKDQPDRFEMKKTWVNG
jgi:hypothetical protein